MTLSNMGDPLISWVRAWSRGHGDGDLHVLTTPEDPGAPRHVDIEWNDAGDTRRLVLAECWWAESFSPPSVRQVLVWGPLMAWRAMYRMAAFVAGPAIALLVLLYLVTIADVVLLVWVALAGLVALLLVLPLVLAVAFVVLRLLPGTKRLASVLAGVLTGHLGDAWVLRNSETRFAAMRARCLADLTWLSERCERVVVVAHSQGSVVAAETLAATAQPRCDVFVTVGSAIGMLRRPGDDPVDRIRSKRPTLRWLNVYSQLDPVSAGPIAGNSAYPVEILAHNAGSAAAAHVTYQSNKEGFQSVVLAALRYASRLGDEQLHENAPEVRPFTHGEENEFQQALRLRVYRSVARMFARVVTPLVAPGIALLLLRLRWPQTAENLVNSTKVLPDWLAATSLGALSAGNGAAAFAGISALALAMIYQGCVVGSVSRWWDRRATAQLAAGRPTTQVDLPLALLVLALLPLPSVALVGAVADGNDHWWAYVATIAAISVIAVVVVGVRVPPGEDELDEADSQFLRQHLNPAFPAFAPNISNIEGALASRANTHMDVVSDHLANHLAREVGATVRVLRAGERELTLSDGRSVVITPASFAGGPQGDGTFTSNLPWRPKVDAFVLIDLSRADEATEVDLARLPYYIVVDPTVGTRSAAIFPAQEVTRDDLAAARAGPVGLDELTDRLERLPRPVP